MPISSFYGLQTSLRGLLAQQRLIDTTGHNIANASTKGYSRQEATLVASPALEIPVRRHRRRRGRAHRLRRRRAVLPPHPRPVRRPAVPRPEHQPRRVVGPRRRARAGRGRAVRAGRERHQPAARRVLERLVGPRRTRTPTAAPRRATSSRRASPSPTRSSRSARRSTWSRARPTPSTPISPPGPHRGEVAQIANEHRRAQRHDQALHHDRRRPERPARPARPAARPAVRVRPGVGRGAGRRHDQRQLRRQGRLRHDVPGRDRLDRHAGPARRPATPGPRAAASAVCSTPPSPAARSTATWARWTRSPATSSPPSTPPTTARSSRPARPAGSTIDVSRRAAGQPVHARPRARAPRARPTTRSPSRSCATGRPSTSRTARSSRRSAPTSARPIRQESNAQVLTDAVENRRQSVSGVSLDEEMSNLVRFQRAYQASARAMSTMDEMLDVLINRTGRVGL